MLKILTKLSFLTVFVFAIAFPTQGQNKSFKMPKSATTGDFETGVVIFKVKNSYKSVTHKAGVESKRFKDFETRHQIKTVRQVFPTSTSTISPVSPTTTKKGHGKR
ncbi:MAG: hypothetical protein IH948_02100 [Bacteroidetes bacterium]|nr:hypothetical protein [Bacteroidota bacterium]